MEEVRKYCVICSLIIVNEKFKDDEEHEENSLSAEWRSARKENSLTDVLKLLLKSRNYCSPPINGHRFLEETFKTLENSNFSLCSDCSEVTSGALKSKARAEKMELEVRSLQLKLLELLRGLQAEMEAFNEEMSKLEDIIVIKSASVEVDQGVRDKEEAVSVREEILEVVTELRFYQADLQDKLIINRVEEQTMLEVSTNEVEVDFLPHMKTEEGEDNCVIDELINFDLEGAMEVDQPEMTLATTDLADDNSRYVGHCVGLAPEDAKKNENRRKNLRAKGFVWRERCSSTYLCALCGDRLPTQNKLTRHLKRAHGQIPGAERAERLKRPAIRFNNEAVSEEILSKALVCMTKNVEEKDRNTKTIEERKKARQEKLALLRAQWKTIRKSMKKGGKPQSSLKRKEKTRKALGGKGKGLLQKIRKTVQKDNTVPRVEGKTDILEKEKPDPTNILVGKSSVLTTVTPSKKRRWEIPERPPLRRSTRGQCVLDMKDVMMDTEKEGRRKTVQINGDMET